MNTRCKTFYIILYNYIGNNVIEKKIINYPEIRLSDYPGLRDGRCFNIRSYYNGMINKNPI